MSAETLQFLAMLLVSPLISGIVVVWLINNPEALRKNQESKDNDQYARIAKLEARLEEKDKEDHRQTLEIQKIASSLTGMESRVFDDLKYLRQVNDQISQKFERYLVLDNNLTILTNRVSSLEEKYNLLKEDFNKFQLKDRTKIN